MNPKPLLHLEAAAVFVASLLAYQHNQGSWLLFVLPFLVPDLSMVGYIFNPRLGAITYNAIHTYVGALALGGYSLWTGRHLPLLLALIWIGQIGFDRMLGFGLKYPSRFKDAHLDSERHGVGGEIKKILFLPKLRYTRFPPRCLEGFIGNGIDIIRFVVRPILRALPAPLIGY